jgi:hypothetical protein
MAAELSNQVYTAPQAPDYLGHYAELLRSIPNYGDQFARAQIQQAQLEQAQAQFELMKQKAKAFTDLYPAWKAAQIEKLQQEAATFPYKQALLQEQAGLARARGLMYQPPTDNADPTAGAMRPARPGSKPSEGGPISPFAPVPGLPRAPYTGDVPVVPAPVAIPESDVPPTGLTTTGE